MQEIYVIFIIIFFTLIILTLIIALFYLFQQTRQSQSKFDTTIKDYENKIKDMLLKHQDEIKKARFQSVETSRNVIKGQIAEQFAPLLPGFSYAPSDSHFLGSPIDYIIFNGYTELKENNPTSGNLEVVLLDIKYNTASLTERQKRIGEAIVAGKIRFEVVRINPDGTIHTESWGQSKNQEISHDESQKNITLSEIETELSENMTESYKNMQRFLNKYPKAYEPWDETDDNLLIENFTSGMKINELSILLKRNPGKIRLRLKEKGLI